MRDVLGVDVERDDAAVGHDHPVDRDGAVRVGELPVELVGVDSHVEPLLRRARRGRVLDPGQLVEHERGDRGQDHDRRDRPGQLEASVAADLRALDATGAAAAAEAKDEEEERRLDEHEDRPGDAEDHVVHVGDPMRTGRVRRGGREAPVCRRRAPRRQEGQPGEDEPSDRWFVSCANGHRTNRPEVDYRERKDR